MNTDKFLLLVLILGASVSILLSLKNFFVTHGVLTTEGFRSYSADFNADILDGGEGKCRCKNSNLGDVALYLDADACVCNAVPQDRDRPELMPGELAQKYRYKHPYYDLNCHLRHEYDSHVDITVPRESDTGQLQPMKFQTYKKNAYAHSTDRLNFEDSYEEQYKKSMTSMTKNLQDRPYLYTNFENDNYFEDWAKPKE